MSDWENLANRLLEMNVDFVVKPYKRFKGEIGEQSTLFIKDPSNNFLEFKAFSNDKMIFETTK